MSILTMRRLSLAALLALPLAAAAQTPPAASPDDDDKPWAEIVQTLPPAPKDADLVPVKVSPTSHLAYAVDARSLSVTADGLVRYTLVARSASGARNVSHEGLRCLTFEMKYYAFGRADGSWAHSQRDQWTLIPSNDPNNVQATLARDIFCSGRAVDGKAERLLRKLRGEPTFE